MIQRGSRARFALEAVQPGCVGGKSFGQDFEGDLAAKLAVARAEHLSHGARAQRAQDLILPNLCPLGEEHLRRIIDRLACGAPPNHRPACLCVR